MSHDMNVPGTPEEANSEVTPHTAANDNKLEPTSPRIRVGSSTAPTQPDRASRMGEPEAGVAGPSVSTDRRGKRSPETYAALAERDRLVRALAARFFGGMSLLAQARQVHVELSRYASSAWVLERVLDECPQRHLGRAREFAWHILRTRDYIPSVRALRRTLANKHF